MLKQLKYLRPKSQLVRSVSMLMGGTASAQLLMVLAAPFLTRLYKPEDFGVLAVYTGLLALLAVIASLRYQLAIPLPACDQEAANIVVLCLMCLLGTTLLSAFWFFCWCSTSQCFGCPRPGKFFMVVTCGRTPSRYSSGF